MRRRFRHSLHHGQFHRAAVDWAEVLTEAHLLSTAWGGRASIRTGDLIHLALAEALDADRFVTADRRQADAARMTGLTVDRVGRVNNLPAPRKLLFSPRSHDRNVW